MLVDLRLVTQNEYHTDMTVSGEYHWVLEPEQAGELTAEGDHATVKWNNEYRGLAFISYRIGNECGESDNAEALSIRITNSTSVDENGNIASLEAYPNPASERIDLKANVQGNQILIRIIDATGRTVYLSQKKVEGSMLRETLNTAALRNGLYNLQVVDGNHIQRTRIIIKK